MITIKVVSIVQCTREAVPVVEYKLVELQLTASVKSIILTDFLSIMDLATIIIGVNL